MPKKPPTETDHADAPTATPRRSRRRASPKSSRVTQRPAIATSPQLARIEHALRDAADAAFHLAHDLAASATERACIRRVRRALLSSTPGAPEFEDLAVTADALLRAFEKQPSSVEPSFRALLIHEIASSLSAPRTTTRVHVRRVPMQRPARPVPFHSFDSYGLT